MNIVNSRNLTTFIILKIIFFTISSSHHVNTQLTHPRRPIMAHATHFVFFVSPLASALYFVLPNSSIVILGLLEAFFLSFMTSMVKNQQGLYLYALTAPPILNIPS